jgi:hypothetical protein
MLRQRVLFAAQGAASALARMVQKLAWESKDDPDTLRLLKDRAANDLDQDVRSTAVQELACGWENNPDVQAFIAALRPKRKPDKHPHL